MSLNRRRMLTLTTMLLAAALMVLVARGSSGVPSAQAQQPAAQPVAAPGVLIPLIGTDIDSNTRVAPPPTTPGVQRAQTATFIVNYSASFTPAAKTAFQAAVDIWSTFVQSNVPIVVDANWAPLNPGVLGSAGPTYIFRDFANAPQSNTWFPVAIANKLAGSDLVGGDAQISASFSSNFPNWYFGTDGNTPAGQYDFMSVVLHELGHGLGFLGFSNVSGGVGAIGYCSPTPCTRIPSIYDRFSEDGSGTDLVNYPNSSPQLAAAFTSNNLFWNGTQGVAGAGGTRPQLYAPASYSGGSSYSHLNEATYPKGNVNSLMTPQIGTAESIQNPGPITLGMFTDMGWTVGAGPTPTPAPTPTPTPTPSGTPGPTPTPTPVPTPTPTPCPGCVVALSVQPSLARVVQNNNVQVAVQAVIPVVGLGSWSVDLNFGTAATFVSCTPIGGGACTAAKPAPANSVRITGSGNLSGTQTLATVTLNGKVPGTLPSTSALTLSANSLFSPLSALLTANPTNGTLRVLPALPDANQDGVANAVDTLCVLRRVASMAATAACPNPLPYADINGDGVINAVDAQCVQRYIAGLPQTAPNCLQAIGVGLTGAIVAPPPDDDDPEPVKTPPPSGTP